MPIIMGMKASPNVAFHLELGQANGAFLAFLVVVVCLAHNRRRRRRTAARFINCDGLGAGKHASVLVRKCVALDGFLSGTVQFGCDGSRIGGVRGERLDRDH